MLKILSKNYPGYWYPGYLKTHLVKMAGIALKRSVRPCFHNGPSKGVDKRKVFMGESKILEDVKHTLSALSTPALIPPVPKCALTPFRAAFNATQRAKERKY